MIGVNQGTTTAYMSGESPNPYAIKPTGSATVWVILFIIAMISIAVALYIRQQKLSQRTTSFTHLSKDEMDKKQAEYDELNDEPEELGADGGDAKVEDGDEEQNDEKHDNKQEDENARPVAIN